MNVASSSRPAHVARRLAIGALVAASLGIVEMALAVDAASTPSVARRLPYLLAYGAVLYGLFGLAVGLAAELVHALWKRRSPYALAAHVAAWCAFVTLGLLLLHFDRALTAQRGGARWWTLGKVLLGTGGTGLLVLGIANRFVRGLRGAVARLVVFGVLFALLFSLISAWSGLPQDEVAARPSPPADPNRPHVVVVLVDTLRRDALGCYGNEGGATATVDALAARGTVFERALSTAPWTLPSVASLFTGRYPREHGCVDFDRRLTELAGSLPEALRQAGYHTRASIGNVLLSHEKGFDRHFDRYDVYGNVLEAELYASKVTAELLRLAGPLRRFPRIARFVLRPRKHFPFVEVHAAPAVLDTEVNERLLRDLPDDRPLFLYAHYTAPHRPYAMHRGLTSEPWPRFDEANLELLRTLYQREVDYMDQALAELFSELEARGILEHAVVAFLSDHGEEFLEHGAWRHGAQLFEETVGIPMLFAGPGVPEGGRIEAPASLVDVTPTLLALCGLAARDELTGRNLFGDVDEPDASGARAYSETVSRELSPDASLFSLVQDDTKVIGRLGSDGQWLDRRAFDLVADPAETTPLEAIPDALWRSLAAYGHQAPPEARDDTPSALDRMRALGYGH